MALTTSDTVGYAALITLVVTPGNNFFLNMTGPGRTSSCTMTGWFQTAQWTSGSKYVSFAQSDDTQNCYWSSYRPSGPNAIFTSWSFDTSSMTFTVTLQNRATESDLVGTPSTWTLSPGQCSSRQSAAVVLPQGLYNASNYAIWSNIFVVGDLAVYSSWLLADNGKWWPIVSGGRVSWLSYYTINGVTYGLGPISWNSPLNAGSPWTPTIYNFTYNPSTNSQTRTAQLALNLNSADSYTYKQTTGIWFVTSSPSSLNGGSAGDDDSDGGKKSGGVVAGVIIAVIAVIVIVAIIVVKSRSAAAAGTGQQQDANNNYRPMNV